VTVMFTGTHPEPGANIVISDAAGRKVKIFRYNGSGEQTISVKGLGAGIYSVHAEGSGRSLYLNRLAIID
jgi:hypothetical protein